MTRTRVLTVALAACCALLLAGGVAKPPSDTVLYVPEHRDPVISEMRAKGRAAQQARQEETTKIRAAQHEQETHRKDDELVLRFDLSEIERPASPEAFQPAFHFPPLRQYRTGNCWAYSATSFFESEVARLSGRQVKLSEPYVVYFDYVEKARRYVRERGASYFAQGSQGTVVPRLWAQYGAVPAEAYRGTRDAGGRHDDEELADEMKAYLELVRSHELWDEDLVVAALRLILDKHMGPPPKRFTYEGVEMTPAEFLADVLRLKLDDYVNLMSTLAAPPHTCAEYEVPANWWHQEYYNVPLEEFYGVIRYALEHGYTVRLNGDTTEPGYDGCAGIAVVPSFDIPAELINPAARELRIFQRATDDDHDIHAVGRTRVADRDWFLIKDSSNQAQCGTFKGYFFYREDYIKLKMLTYTVHKDAVLAIVKGFEARGR